MNIKCVMMLSVAGQDKVTAELNARGNQIYENLR